MRPPLAERGERGASAAPAGGAEALDAILVLRTLGAPERHRLRGRRGREVDAIEPMLVPISRVTVVRPAPFADARAADRWLDDLRGDADAAHAEADAALAVVNRAVQAYRIAAADAYVTAVTAARALVTRIGYGEGVAVADGEADRAWELPPGARRRRLRSMEAPDERFAAILGGRREALACEELVLRAAADLRAGRDREAALEARIALEALVAELGDDEPEGRLADARAAVAEAAGAALRGPLDASRRERLAAVVDALERRLRNRRLTT
ncbi:MAG TPA: hypothetical protein VFK14_07525 [Solirubrobacterales bacterium]|nr:hypothetical protein [Solirubrobacterales bacterium]